MAQSCRYEAGKVESVGRIVVMSARNATVKRRTYVCVRVEMCMTPGLYATTLAYVSYATVYCMVYIYKAKTYSLLSRLS